MHYKKFQKNMKKPVFTWEEAKIVAFNTPPNTLKLQLHQWKKEGDIIALKRGVYLFSDRPADKIEIAKHLYSPCYLSMEYALNHHGLLPDVAFAMTMVTIKPTRRFQTPVGLFTFQKIKQAAFSGFDPDTLMAECEKALVDYLYLNVNHLVPKNIFWKEMRWQNLKTVRFSKALTFAQLFKNKKLITLVRSLQSYAKSS